MPSPNEEPSCPPRRAPRHQAGRFLLGVVALLALVATVAFARLVLRAEGDPGLAALAAPEGRSPASALNARPGASPGEPTSDRSRPAPSEAPTPSPPEQASAPARAGSPATDSLDDLAASTPSASPPTDHGSSAPHPGGSTTGTGSAAREARWAARNRLSGSAAPVGGTAGPARLAGSNVPADPASRPRLATDAASATTEGAEQPLDSQTATPRARVPAPAEIIERSKRLHELRLEALRQSAQLPPED